MKQVNNILKKMTLSEKVSLLVGRDFWNTNSLKRFKLPSICVSDGPFGVRKVEQRGLSALDTSLPATAFPTTSALACTFDDELLKEVGIALAKECIDQGVDVILGPGLNIKRSPLCGRNFEYFSEDPYLSGRLATAMVEAIQSQGVGTSVKHFAVNNQEQNRLLMNAIVDERALFEIYLRAFEMVIKKAKPWTVMCSYNQVNGMHASRNDYLLKTILREKWGYQGLVVSDWGAVVNNADSVKAGLNLEMPGRKLTGKKLSRQLLRAGVTEKEIDEAVRPLLKLMLEKKARVGQRDHSLNYGDNHNLAVRVATEAAVLLKNDNHLLPLNAQKKIAVIGNFAKNPRYQGSGSSRINPKMIETLVDALSGHNINFDYADGYAQGELLPDEERIKDATEIAKDKDAVILMVGLPDEFEMEGMDREHIDLPLSHNRLVEAVMSVNPNVIVVLSCGSAVRMPWLEKVRSILHMHLAGQGSGEAIYQLIYGQVNPSGKLSETYPLKLEDVPTFKYFGGKKLNIEYRESIYVGYRYYQKAERPVLFPFGYGLSYTDFTYKDIELSDTNIQEEQQIKVSFTLKNIGNYDGAEVVQLYGGLRKQETFQAPKVLCNYKKVFLKSGQEIKVEFSVSKDDFAIYDVGSKTFRTENGTYTIYVGSSSEDIKLSRMIKIETDFILSDESDSLKGYYKLNEGTLDIPFEQFAYLYGQRIKHYNAPSKRPFSANNTLNDARTTRIGRFIIKKISLAIKNMAKGDPLTEQVMLASFLDTPIRSYFAFTSGTFSKRQIKGLVNVLNFRLVLGLLRLIPTPKQIRMMKKGQKYTTKPN